MLAGDPRGPLDLRHDRGVVPDLRARGDAARERRADQALVDERLVVDEQAHRVEHGHHGRRAGAAGRPIHLRVGEDRHVAQVRAARRWRAP